MNGRIFISAGLDPWYAMAFDDWLLARLRRGSETLAVRVYSWGSDCVTVGYNQRLERALDSDLLPAGVPVIRRLTGGRAIFHDPGEITFTVASDLRILPEEERPLHLTNSLISETIVKILDKAGVKSNWEKNSDPSFARFDEFGGGACFNSVTRYEVTTGAGKIVGGAQRRIGDYFIHQGSIKLRGISACPAIGQKGLPPEELGLRDKVSVEMPDLAVIFKEEFSEAFGRVMEETTINDIISGEIGLLADKLKKNPLGKRPED